jgi:UDP-N-acetyl-2-amino-2-deoxyglucuronate dehydrogenase
MGSENEHKIKFAIAGYGHIGRRHAAEITNHGDGTLAAVVEIESEVALLAAKENNVPIYSDLETLFAKHDDIDVLNICTPNGLHIGMAMKGIKGGANVLVEKPMGLQKADCDALMVLADKKQKQVFCVLQNRYSPPAQFINKMIREKRLGDIYWVSINCYWNRDDRYYTPGSWRGTKNLDGGPLYTQFSHFIDLLYWNFGPIKNLKGVFYNNNHHYLEGIEDTGTFHFEFEKGGAGQFSYSTALYQSNLESSITIIGEKGTIKAGGQYMEKIDFFKAEGLAQPELEPALPANDYGTHKGSAANHAFVIDNVIRALKGEPYEMATAADAEASVDIIERVYRLRDNIK